MKDLDEKQILEWIAEAGRMLRESLAEEREVSEKSGALDLVTDMDRKIEQFLVSRIRESYPADQILGEEGTGDQVVDMHGRVWILDPIDGTMNFIKQQENFAIMVAVVEEGVGRFGFIYDVMRERLVWGGPETGVFYNGQLLPPLKNPELKDSLVAINWQMFGENVFNVKDVAWNSCGVRIQSCAGMEFIQLLLGKQAVYISKMAPWDFAAGKILCEARGLLCSTIRGEPLKWLEPVQAVFGEPRAYQAALKLMIDGK